jgi:ABC-type phosphate transport system ATPase subunit
MTAPSLPAALRAGAAGLYALKAAAGLIIAHGTWLTRDDFACFVEYGTGTAAIDWEAAACALETGALPCSGGERRMLTLASSLAGQTPVILGDAITGIDDPNVGLLVQAVLHAFGQRQFPAC